LRVDGASPHAHFSEKPDSLVIIRTMSGQAPLDSFSTGTLAGAGCFRCGNCGFAVALHERDEVPACPHCGGEDFRRSSIFGELEPSQPQDAGEVESPDWLDEAREAVEREGDYLAYEHDGRLRVIALEGGWTRIGRSLAADIRFDHSTVSRRHAMVHRAEGVTRVLDDRSLNGVFVNGERVDMRTLSDGDELTIGRFRLYFMSLTEVGVNAGGIGVPGALA
jgi:predicted  nucleic acid-binding Zn-ribbon protein